MKTFLESSSEVNFNIITICQNNLEGLQRTVSSIKIQGHKKIKLILNFNRVLISFLKSNKSNSMNRQPKDNK
jgi:hypothetical protein